MENGKYEGEVKIKTPLLSWLENFWYHYKWYTIVGAFLVFAFVVLSLQMCSKTSFDAHIIYAGNHEIKRVSDDGDTSPYNKMLGELKLAVGDTDGDGTVNIDLRDLFVVNDAEAEELVGSLDGYEINENLVKEDSETLYQLMLMSDYYVCFLSERLYTEYSAQYSGLFEPIAKYAAEDGEYVYLDECAIYLNSVGDFATMPEISRLPSDTVICLRSLSEMSEMRYKDTFKEAEDIVRNILAFER